MAHARNYQTRYASTSWILTQKFAGSPRVAENGSETGPKNTIAKKGGVARLQATKDPGERGLELALARDKAEEQGGVTGGYQEQHAGEHEAHVKQMHACSSSRG